MAQLGRRAPATTRKQAKMVGRYYWYSHAKAARLGYSPRPARLALAAAIAWLAASPHISREVRARMLLSREVYEERRKLACMGSSETHEAIQKSCHRQASS